jgi:uncharacterized protein (DUF58 family)
MWWKNISRRRSDPVARSTNQTLFDEAFLRRLERLGLQARRTLRGGLSGSHPSLRRLPAPTFSDHRPYTTSDDPRYVDWNAYARQEHLFVKLGETEQDVPVHLLLDRSASMDYGTGDNHKLQYGRMLLAALGYIALGNGDRLSATAFDKALTPAYGPYHSKQHTVELLRYAAQIKPGGSGSVAMALENYTRSRQGGLLVLISDLWAVEDLQQALRQARPPQWQVVLFHLLHRDEMEPALRGEVELEDSESGARMPLSVTATLLQQYNLRLKQWCDALETTSQRYGAAYVRITTDLPLEQVVIPYLRQRQVLGGLAR